MRGASPLPPRVRRRLVPAGIFLLGVILAELVGFEMRIPWSHYQILDREVLEATPFGALLLLHSQPPVMNGLLAFVLALDGWLGGSPELWIKAIFLAVSFVAVLALHDLLERTTRSPLAAALGAALLVSNPAFHFFGNLGWYPQLVAAEVILLVHSAERLFRTGERRYLRRTLGLLVAIALTRSLFHPLWSLVTIALVAAPYARRFPEQAGGLRGLAGPIGVTVLLLALWPVKNLVVFGQATYSSWTGVNLASLTPIPRPEWNAYLARGEVPERVQLRADGVRARYGDPPAAVVTAPEKSDGSRNWNHLLVLELNRELTSRSLRWRLENPGEWLRRVVVQYLMSGRGSFIQAYSGEIRGPENRWYRGYAGLYRDVWYPDVRPLVEPLAPNLSIHALADRSQAKSPLPYTLFALVWFPLVLAAVGVELSRRRNRESPLFPLAALCLFQILWVAVVPCLTIGTEGNRMRYSTSALFTLLLFALVHLWWNRHRSRDAR